MYDRSVRSLHELGMSKLRGLVDKKVRVVYNDESFVIVSCTISDETMELMKYNDYVGQDTKVFNILLSDLIADKGKVTDFKYIEYNRVKYQVLTKISNGNYDNTLKLVSRVFRGGLNE